MTSGRRALRTSACALTAMVLTAALLTLGSRGSVGVADAADAPVTTVAWEQWQHVPGVIDLAGPRRDGRLVAAANGRLVLIDPATGTVSAYAPVYSVRAGPESYIALSPGLAVDGAHCRFRRDDVYALDYSSPLGVKRIARGTVSDLATIPGVTTLTGIAFDTVGRFGHRLLVMGLSEPGRTRVSAVDCRGNVTSIGVVDIGLEGGMAVAPRDFGLFGGQLFAASEATGEIVAVSSGGLLSAVAPSGVEAGDDIGVQGVGFVPARGTPTAYLADRGGQSPPHAGTDSVLRLGTSDLDAAAVEPGDLLVATEGGATVVDVRCSDRCTVTRIATGPSIAHGEGHVLIVAAPR